MNEQLIEDAVRIAKKLIKPYEGLNLTAYADPASALYKALSKAALLKQHMAGAKRPKGFEGLSGAPYTIGYGSTEGVKEGDVWTPQQAENTLDKSVRARVLQVLSIAPNLAKHSPEKLAACTSLQYNIGNFNFQQSTLVKKLLNEDMQGAADQFLVWNLAKGVVMNGLVTRRKAERDLFLSARN